MSLPVEDSRAMLVVHSWALDGGTVYEHDPTPISDRLRAAARTLQRAADDGALGGESRRRKAIALIAGRGRSDPAASDALTTLRAPMGAIDDFLRDSPPWAPRKKEVELANFLDEELGLVGAFCPRKFLEVTVKYEEGEGTVGESRLRVRAPFEEVACAVDPQSWGGCSLYFAETYKAEAGQYGEPDPEVPRLPRPDGNPPAPGSTWPEKGILYEHFRIDFGWTRSEFKNSLDVDCARIHDERGHPSFRVGYDLGRPLWSRVLGTSQKGGVLVDYGKVEVVNVDQEWQEVFARKVIRFADRDRPRVPGSWLDRMAAVLLFGMGWEMSELACCDDCG